MTIDITALASMVRRFDVSATLKSFVVLAALVLVLTNLAVIGQFVAELLDSDFLESDDGSFLIAASTSAVAFSFTPLAFIFWDWMARQPWRYLAAIVGASLGGLGFALVGGAAGSLSAVMLHDLEPEQLPLFAGPLIIALSLLVPWMIVRSQRIRRATGWALIGLGVLLVCALLYPLLEEALQEAEMTADLIEATVTLGTAAVALWLFSRAIRHRIALSGDRPRELMLGAIHRKKFWPRMAFLAGLPSSLWYARAMLTPAFWDFLFARPLVYAGLVVLAGNVAVDAGSTARIAIGIGLIAGGHLLFSLGKRLAARRIWKPDDPVDKRSPVLFLRSFEDDQLRFKRPWWDLFGRWVDLWSFRRNADEAMIDEIAQYGPVVALGMPGEKRVPFGASRYYSTHDDWQRIVSDSAKRAHAIVIGAGDTPGVRWEYGLLARENLLDRTVMLFPPEADDPFASASALTAFAEATGIEAQFDIRADRCPIALLHTDAGATLLTAQDPGASAYLAAVRGHFQGCSAENFADKLGL